MDGLWDELDYFDIMAENYSGGQEASKQPWPKYRWIACYAVIGSNEGHYVHIDVVYKDNDVIVDPHGKNQEVSCQRMMFLGKTFAGFDKAWDIARACARHLAA